MPLPRIACFHGGGSTAAIYQIQCARLESELRNDFEFVYFDAPFERSAGPGVLPYFTEERYAPYRTWFKSDELGDGSGYESSGKDGVARVWQMMRDAGPGGEWVAVMGFSQGSRVAGGLLLDQQLRAQAGIGNDIELKFGVLCMGSGAPMVSEMSRGWFPFLFLMVGIKADFDRYPSVGRGPDYDSNVPSSWIAGWEFGEWEETAGDVL